MQPPFHSQEFVYPTHVNPSSQAYFTQAGSEETSTLVSPEMLGSQLAGMETSGDYIAMQKGSDELYMHGLEEYDL